MTGDSDTRVIDAAGPTARYARGWHCLGPADGYRDGKPHTLEAFGTELVVFAGANGKLNVLNAYCPHMGGNLADGTVKGDSLACPFHDWRWGGNGRCTGIPYARRVPPLARTKAWRTMEENRQLFVWNDPEGNPPPDDVTIPRIEGAFSDEWTDWTWKSIVVDSNCREVVDNVVDMAHFFYVHLGFPIFFKNVFENHIASQYMTSVSREDTMGETAKALGGKNTLHSDASYYGPSYMIDHLRSESDGTTVEGILINCHYPVTPDRFVLQYGMIVKLPTDRPRAEAEEIAAGFAGGMGAGFEQDIAIWQRKTRINNPLLCEEDGPVYQLRRWYQQFYTDVADVSEEMTARFEFEVDTSRAVTVWEAEVAENLARRAAAQV
ncbi:phenylpropionate dioxygenase-like ring-hydroxylating dioxygenase large terminal subunit [Nocardia transvalensis]|uniref:Rieske-type oxygenase n=1 Tax=Nocardia transvalensis TaxID=37333 RepID=A0A7W9UMQ5_9NOCA|nr:Rieske 2Fe-2S domain-containing protein [Nocardia transvalensis]MBB5918617.1 phenylpropionate dioxygenase-like ring-hydroxylating dioxygenase large terminal subunit [Nocardia transvalensis]